jgi:fibronectin-binding autotransporter adhesin
MANNLTVGAGTTVQLAGGATLTGTGSLAGTGRFSWTGGAVQGNLSVGRTVTTAISGTATKSVSSPSGKPITMTLNGPTGLTGTGQLELGTAATLRNAGILTLAGGTTIDAGTCCAAPDHLLNSGTLLVAAAKKSTATISLLALVNSGTVKLASGTLSVGTLSYRQTAGTTTLAGGSLTVAQPADISGGTLTGFGTIHGSVTSSGTVRPSTTGGKLTFTGDYAQSKTGTLATTITGTTPGTKFGQLVVNGTAKLAGTLKASTGGGFKPKKGQSFVVLSCKTRSGKFAKHTGTPSYRVSYGAKLVKVIY